MAESVKGLNIKLGLDTTELEHKLKDINSNLKEQARDLKAINTALKYDPTNVTLWKQKQEQLNKTINETKKKLQAQNEKLAQAKKALKLGDITEVEFNQIRRSVMYTEASIKNFNNQLQKTKAKITEIGDLKWNKMSEIGGKLTRYITTPIIGATTALSHLSIKSMEYADDIADSADKVYLTAEAYQEWSHTFEILAVDNKTMQKAFTKTNSLLGEIAKGDGERFAKSLELIGLKLEDLQGLSTDEAFTKLRDAMSKTTDETKRIGAVTEIFGERIGQELAQVLKVSSDEIVRLRQETHKLGIVTNEQADVAGKFTDQMANLKHSLQIVGVELAIEVVPILTKLMTLIQEKGIPKIKQFINMWHNFSSKHKKTIAIIVGITATIPPLLFVVGKVVPLIKTVMEAMEGLNIVTMIAGNWWIALIAILAIILLKNEKFRELLKHLVKELQRVLSVVVDTIGVIINSLKPAFDILMGAINQIIDIVVDLLNELIEPITQILDVVIDVIKQIMPIIKAVIQMLVSALKPILSSILKLLKPLLKINEMFLKLHLLINQKIIEFVKKLLPQVIKVLNFVTGILSQVADVIVSLVNVLVDTLVPIIEAIIELLEPIIDIITTIIDAVFDIMQSLTPLLDIALVPLQIMLKSIVEIIKLIAPILEIVAKVIKAVIIPVLKVLHDVLKPILDILSSIIDGFKWLSDKVGGLLDWVGDKIKSLGDSIFFDASSISPYQNIQTNQSSITNVTNTVTVNTTSDKFDVDSINVALGGEYL